MGIRFYKNSYGIDDVAEKRKIEMDYDKWLDECRLYVFEATKAANWVADVVRRDISPLFFATQGKFIITHGPYDFNMRWHTDLLEYSDEEKAALPDLLFQKTIESSD